MKIHALRPARGLSLIELMLVAAVIAVLAGVAVPAYRQWLLRAARSDAVTALLRIQLQQERYFLQHQRYAVNDAELQADPPLGLGFGAGARSERGHYQLSLASEAPGRYTATAQAAGRQLQDSAACQALSLNELGERTPAAAAGCWR
jgi:type IV pilus assembly protein PilE